MAVTDVATAVLDRDRLAALRRLVLLDTSLESHSTEIEGRRFESKTRQGLDATNQPQRLPHRQSGASRGAQ